jgi:hypothetical protein
VVRIFLSSAEIIIWFCDKPIQDEDGPTIADAF